MEHVELVIRDYGGSTKFPELNASLVYILPGGGEVALLTNCGAFLRPDVAQRYLVEPFKALGVPVRMLNDAPLPTDDVPVPFSNYDRLWMQVECMKAVLLSLAERVYAQSQLLSANSERKQ